MSKNKKEFLLLTLFLVLTRFTDIITTYKVTPDLKTETNPLVSIFGQGWTSIIIFQIMLVCVVIILNYYSLFKTKVNYPLQKGYSHREFITYYYFGEKQSLIRLLYKFPKEKSVLIKALGYVLPRSLIIVSLFISSSSTLLILNDDYQKFYTVARPYYYMILIPIVFLFFILFFKREYKIYREL